MSPSKALCVGVVLLPVTDSTAFSRVGGTMRPERSYEAELIPIHADRPYEYRSGLLSATSAKMETSYGNCALPHLPYHWRLEHSWSTMGTRVLANDTNIAMLLVFKKASPAMARLVLQSEVRLRRERAPGCAVSSKARLSAASCGNDPNGYRIEASDMSQGKLTSAQATNTKSCEK